MIKEVSVFQRSFCMLLSHVVGMTGIVMIREMSLFRRSLIERFYCNDYVIYSLSVSEYDIEEETDERENHTHRD